MTRRDLPYNRTIAGVEKRVVGGRTRAAGRVVGRLLDERVVGAGAGLGRSEHREEGE